MWRVDMAAALVDLHPDIREQRGQPLPLPLPAWVAKAAPRQVHRLPETSKAFPIELIGPQSASRGLDAGWPLSHPGRRLVQQLPLRSLRALANQQARILLQPLLRRQRQYALRLGGFLVSR